MSDALDSRARILIVDDEKANIMVLSTALEGEYALSVARNGAEALAAARAKPRPDLILLDVMMPAPNGFSVCQELKADASTADIPVIFVTSMNDNVNEEVGLKLGAVDYINKPISPPVVKARIAVHLRLKLQNEFLSRLLDQRTKDLETARREARALFKPG
jgi:putative two-component system response regulator